MPAFAFNLTTEFLIPFMFTFAILLGVLELSLKTWSKPVKTIISLTIAFFATSYQPFTAALWSLLPSITWFFIIMFFLVFILEIFGIRKAGQKAEPGTLVIQGAILLVLMGTGYYIIRAFPGIDIPFVGGPENILLLIGIFLILTIFWTAFKIGQGGGEGKK